VRITAITRDTLLKLVGGQMPHELSKYSLTDIHPSLSAIATPLSLPAVERGIYLKSSNRQIQVRP